MKSRKLPIEYYQKRNNLKNNFFVFKQDIGLSHSIRVDETWEKHVYDYLNKLNINFENTNIIDIGANLGAHTLSFADMVGDSGNVYAFEPQRIVYYQLCGNIISNGFDNIYAYNIALSDENGKTHVEKQDFYFDGMLNIGDAHISDTGDEVEQRTLDSYRFENISLIKIDVQGYETKVLNGAVETINKNRPIILIEIDDPQLERYNTNKQNIIDFFNRYSYNLQQIKDLEYIAIPEPRVLVMSCCYNEQEILPFYLDYYKNFLKVDKIVIYDGGSTDNSQKIIRDVASEYNIDLIIDQKDKLDDRYLNDLRNNGWKSYRDKYDWIIVCDMDEFIYHPNLKEKLLQYDREGITIPLTDGFDMISKKFPVFEKGKYIQTIVKKGIVDNIFLSKKSIFKSSIDINYHIGAHGSDPGGAVKYAQFPEIKHLHFKWLSHKYLTRRSANVADRLSDWNLSGGCGSHNRPYSLTKVDDFIKRYDEAIQVLEGAEEKENLYAFSHNYLINNWEEIVDDHLRLLKSSGLYYEITNIFMYAFGNDSEWNKLVNKINKYDDKYRIELIRIENNFYEFPTLQNLYQFCKDRNYYILYFHTKGVWSTLDTGKNTDAIKSWRKCLEYFTIEKWKNCIQKLNEGYEVVGALYNYNKVHPLFSGNFWWSKSEYIKKLKYPDYDPSMNPYLGTPEDDGTWTRVECEKWINTIPNNFYNFYIPKDYGFYYVPIKEEDYRKEDDRKEKIEELLKKRRMFFDEYHDINRLEGLKDLIEETINKDSVICEIGSFEGVSSELFALYCKELYCVDIWEDYWTRDVRVSLEKFLNEIGSSLFENPVNKNIEAIENKFDDMAKNYSHVKKIKKFSVEASVDFPDEYFDLIYIDASHNYESVKQDITYWLPKIKKSGYISGHDYYNKPNDNVYLEMGVKKAVDEIFPLSIVKIYKDSSWRVKISDINKKIEHIYEKIDGWFGFKETYSEMVNKFPDGSHFVEIGAWLGKSTSYMAVEIANSGKKIKFDTIDKWDGGVELKKHAEDLNNKVQELFLKNIEPVKDFVNVVTGDSHEVYKNYEDESIDFLFIDGSHQYEDVKKDIELWFPKIKRDGVIAGNSYFGGWSGISKAVDEYFGRENISLPNEVWTVHKTDFLNKSIEDKYPEQVVNYRGVIINKKGYWMNDVLMEESFDESLFKELTSVFKDKMVLDLGCGHGYYTKRLLDNGIYCEGYDGNPNTEKLTNGVCKVQDLTVDFNFKKKFDWILCLEVGEHIPTNYEEIFINNLDRNCKDGIVLSWAVVGQGGDGHVNCKSNEDVKKIFEAKGYYNDMELENRLREKAEIHWFKNSLMVFRKSKISIIIPTYNRKEELKECIDSVLNQNYENMEILVCHDGNSLEYDKFKENYTDKRIKFYNTYHQRNNLGASQRNMMLEKVTGNWVLFLDDDNILFNNYLKRMTMEIDDNTAMIVCRIYFNDKEWNNLILPIEDKLIPAQIDHLSILFRADIAKQLMWDNDWGQDHRYINACESIAVSKDLKIKYISDVLADHRYLKPKDYSEELVIVYNNGNIDSFISNMRNYNRKILLTSNNGVDIEIQKKVDYFFLSNNKIILDNFYNCIDFGKNLGFKRFICISSDNDINFMDIDNKMSDIKIKGNKFYYFNKTFFLAIS